MNNIIPLNTKAESPLFFLEQVYQDRIRLKQDMRGLEFTMPSNDVKELYHLIAIDAKHLEFIDGIFYYRNIIIIPE